MTNSNHHWLMNGLYLAWMLARRDLKNRYAASYAGVAWNVGVPLLMALVNVVVFSVLMSGRLGDRYAEIPFVAFFFIPFSLWTLFSESAARSPGILREYAYLVNKIAFPLWVLPLIPLGSALLSQLIMLTLAAALMIYLDVPVADTAAIYLLLWLIALLITIGVTYMTSALAVYVPDLAQAVPVGITILFWLTPILYPASLVEAGGVGGRPATGVLDPWILLVDFPRDDFAVGDAAYSTILG